jgi:CMP-N,N'-diacetyllegionaminic acid synthase
MGRDKLIVGIIPARGGSKSIPRKNIKLLAGKPLFFYTVDEARKSRYIDRLIVSTDDDEIAEIARSYDVEVIMRPPEYATDTACTELALTHVVKTLKENEGYEVDVVVTLEPTSPLRTHQLIDKCIEELVNTDADAVISVTRTSSLVGNVQDGKYEYLIKNQPRRRQDREPLYQESSAVYITDAATLLKYKSVLGQNLHVVIAEEESIDINTPLDFVIAEAVIKWKKEGEEIND